MCGSGQQEEIFYSMAATRVRLEENSYRLSWKEAEAFLFPAIVCVFGRGTTPLILFSYVLPGGTSMLSSFLFSFFFPQGDISGLRPFHVCFFFLPLSLQTVLNTVLLRSDEGGEWCPYVTDAALRPVTQHHDMFWSRRQPCRLVIDMSTPLFFTCVFVARPLTLWAHTLTHCNYTSGREDSNTTVHIYYWWYIYTLLVISDKTPPNMLYSVSQSSLPLFFSFMQVLFQPSSSSIWSKVQ